MLRTNLPIFITFLAGLVVLTNFFIPNIQVMENISTALENWAIILSGSALILGTLNVIRIQVKKINARQKEWHNGLVMLFFLGLVAVPGLVFGDKNAVTGFCFLYIISPLNSTIFSLLAFFMASAAYRAFRARSFEATILLVVAILVMLSRVPMIINYLPEIRIISDWISIYPAMAAIRGIIIGAALGIISTSLRLILGIDRSYLGR